MLADEQDIILLKNIIFKDQNKIDTSLTGHPVLIISVTETHFYYLVITSSAKKKKFLKNNEYYPLEKNNKNKLRSLVSYINLKNIYKQELKNYVPIGYIKDKEYDDIINHLAYYQENIKQDNLYNELLETLNEKPLVRKLSWIKSI